MPMSQVERARSGDKRAFSSLVTRHASMVRAIVLAAVRNPVHADEVVQDVFLLAWRDLSDLRNPAAFSGWLRRLSRNQAKNWVRRNRVRRLVLTDEDRVASAIASDPDGEAALTTAQARRAVQLALGQLPASTREAMLLAYRDDHDHAAIAELLGISEAAARKRLSRGRKVLAAGLSTFAAALLTVDANAGPVGDLSLREQARPTRWLTRTEVRLGMVVGVAAVSGVVVLASQVLGSPPSKGEPLPPRPAATARHLRSLPVEPEQAQPPVSSPTAALHFAGGDRTIWPVKTRIYGFHFSPPLFFPAVDEVVFPDHPAIDVLQRLLDWEGRVGPRVIEQELFEASEGLDTDDPWGALAALEIARRQAANDAALRRGALAAAEGLDGTDPMQLQRVRRPPEDLTEVGELLDLFEARWTHHPVQDYVDLYRMTFAKGAEQTSLATSLLVDRGEDVSVRETAALHLVTGSLSPEILEGLSDLFDGAAPLRNGEIFAAMGARASLRQDDQEQAVAWARRHESMVRRCTSNCEALVTSVEDLQGRLGQTESAIRSPWRVALLSHLWTCEAKAPLPRGTWPVTVNNGVWGAGAGAVDACLQGFEFPGERELGFDLIVRDEGMRTQTIEGGDVDRAR